MLYDCVIIGGGPAGLNAALVLGRAKRTVALFDHNQPRNRVTHASHGFLTRDGITPSEFRRIAYDEVLRYPSVQHWQDEVTDIRKQEKGFEILTKNGEHVKTRKLILSSGLREILPDIEGIHNFYGKSLFNCPYCDGWELRDQPLVVVGDKPGAFHKIKLLYSWSRDLIVCTNGHAALTHEQKELLEHKGIQVIETPIRAFRGENGMLNQVQFMDGSHIERSGGFIMPEWHLNDLFSKELGYDTAAFGAIAVDIQGRSTVPGFYAAGDAAYVGPSQVVFAAASGSKTAMTVNMDLVEEEFNL
ncbi:NAD(P)/FAD-dependent oxidoreductase [Paenibacillus spongiae]|uniref:NAD(P)/FAD-dependent oxidoreductase n=1 Tax=Paenibacillus spongiae TaxID=2909671 RepID=A0ABY5SH27_9BACL|nr:NAD(P)/FAD-dependent oxidoreductase [Paenibacillus spongiae]UVI33306.1 NAD(P)/FAD-dependent oxidoreductase [Paenibacillus spongiae]